MVRVIHATLLRNVASIRKYGLLVRKHTQRRRAVWAAPESAEEWAVKHVLARKGGRMDEVVILTLEVPAEWLKGHSSNTFYICRDVPASHVKGMYRWTRVEETFT